MTYTQTQVYVCLNYSEKKTKYLIEVIIKYVWVQFTTGGDLLKYQQHEKKQIHKIWCFTKREEKKQMRWNKKKKEILKI